MSKSYCGLLLTVFAVVFTGCSQADSGASAGAAPNSAYLMAAEPSGAIGVGEGLKSSDENVVLLGRVGGSAKPFVDGVAAFTIVDPKVPYCAEDEGCPTPWDYCCETHQLKDNSALVKVVDDGGNPVSQDARELLGVKELAMVVVQGKAQRDDQGNLTVLANKVFIKENKR